MASFSYATCNNPCCLCRGTTDCRVSNTSGTFHCRRTPPSNPPPGFVFLKEDRSGFNVFVPIDGDFVPDSKSMRVAEYRNSGKPTSRRDKHDTSNFAKIAAEMQPLSDAQRSWLAAKLHVAPAAIDQLFYATWRDGRGDLQFTTPERNGAGVIVGRNTRSQTGIKRTHGRGGPGPDRGLFIPANDAWRPEPGEPLLVVEGATDTLAWLTMGRGAIGRPSNKGGIEYLADFLTDHHYTGPVLLVGENDRKEDGAWPGLTGAESSALKLAKLYAGPVAYALPPSSFKDSRDYLRARIIENGGEISSYEAKEFGDELLTHLQTASVHVHEINDPPAAEPTAAQTSLLVSAPPITDRWYLLNPNLPQDDAPPPRPCCTNPRGVYLNHVAKLLDRISWHDCQRLVCPGCGPKKREQWRRAFRRHLSKFAADHPDTPLHLYNVTLGKQWNTTHAYLRGGNYFRVNLNGDGYCLVVSVNPPGPQIDAPQIITPAAAIDRLVAAVNAIPKLDRSKLVTSSRVWPIDQPQPKRHPQWRRLCAVVCTLPQALAVLRHRRAALEHVASPDNQTWAWYGVEFTRDFGDVDYNHVAKELVLGQVLPESYTSGTESLAGVGDTGPPGELLAW